MELLSRVSNKTYRANKLRLFDPNSELLRASLRWSGKLGQNRVLSFLRPEREPPLLQVGARRPPSGQRPCPWPVKAPRPRPRRAPSVSTLNASIKWQRKALTPVAAARGAALDPATATELRQPRAFARREAQEADSLTKAIARFLTKAIARFSAAETPWAATTLARRSGTSSRGTCSASAGASQRGGGVAADSATSNQRRAARLAKGAGQGLRRA